MGDIATPFFKERNVGIVRARH